MVVALRDSALLISECQGNDASQQTFKPAQVSSFYGSHGNVYNQKSLEERKEEQYRNTGRFLLLKRDKLARQQQSMTNSNTKKARRDYEIFRDEQKKEIITQCPELLLEYNEAVFRRAARAVWDGKDEETRRTYKEKAGEEKKALAPVEQQKRVVRTTKLKKKTKKAPSSCITKRTKAKAVRLSDVQQQQPEEGRRQSPRLGTSAAATKTKKKSST